MEGGPAVGKTTLAKRLQKRLPDIYFSFEDPKPAIAKAKALNLDKRIEQDFIANQKIFIKESIKRYQNLPSGVVIMDLSPEETEFHTFCWPKLIGQNWDMEKSLAKELTELRKYRSTTILYLDGNDELLRSRKASDKTRSRSSFEEYLTGLHQLRKDWFSRLDYVTIKNVANLSEEKLEGWTIGWLKDSFFMITGK